MQIFHLEVEFWVNLVKRTTLGNFFVEIDILSNRIFSLKDLIILYLLSFFSVLHNNASTL